MSCLEEIKMLQLLDIAETIKIKQNKHTFTVIMTFNSKKAKETVGIAYRRKLVKYEGKIEDFTGEFGKKLRMGLNISKK